jgi:hypothetical protein
MPFAPDQRLPDYFVLIGTDEMPQKPLGGLLVNERGISRFASSNRAIIS